MVTIKTDLYMIRFPICAMLLAMVSFSVAHEKAIRLGTADKAILVDGKVKIVIGLEKAVATSCPSAASWEWGAEDSCPACRIGYLEITYAGKQVFVPYSAFADLGNPNYVMIEMNHNKIGKYSVKIIGGDAATSYSAVLRFRGTSILERIVQHGEFPDEAWERTTYKFMGD